jgi:RepB DNA-primase from phage plasmid
MQRTIEAIEKHLAAIRSPLYEVGVFFPATESQPDSKMLLRTWDEAAVFKSIPWLRAKNAEGAAIYVRPKWEHAYSLVDDLNAEGVARMHKEQFTPAIVVETSPANFQAWVNHGQVLDKRTSTAAARELAQRFGGDPGAADWRHFGRLAGFTNRKAAYLQANGLYPFVTVAEHCPGVYPVAAHFLQTVQVAPKSSVAEFNHHGISNGGPLRSIKAFRADPRYSGDGNRIDLAFAVHALAHGSSVDSVRAALQSRDLAKKGSEARQSAYIDRTISKARQHLSGALRR